MNINQRTSSVHLLCVLALLGGVAAARSASTLADDLFLTAQPQNQSVYIGWDVNFGVAAAGVGPFSYQWQFNGTNINAATNATLVLTNVQPTDAGTYQVTVGNASTSVTSSAASLVVFPLGPKIDSFTPTTGPVGTLVTVSGANFSAIASNNIVTFGIVQAQVVSSSSNQLTVLAPVGAAYGPIGVTVGGLSGASSGAFSVTFPSSGTVDASSFAAQINFPAQSNPGGIALVDIDGDGRLDVVVVNMLSNDIQVFRNIGTNQPLDSGCFAPPVSFPVGPMPWVITAADLDGDGKPDLIIANTGGSTISILRNTSTPGNVSFASSFEVPVGQGPWQVAVGDVDGDGHPDLAVANYRGNSVSLLRNISVPGKLAFEPHVDFFTGTGVACVAIADIDGDGKLDLAVANDVDGTLSILRNTATSGTISTNSFGPSVNFSVGWRPLGVAVGDLDGDGKPEVIVSTYGSCQLSVFRNVSQPGVLDTNSLAPKFDLPVGMAHRVVLCDVDGDGKVDLTAPCEIPAVASIYKNVGNGPISAASFAPRVDFAAGINPDGLSFADLDGDGRPDMVVANYYANTISLFKNTVAGPNPAVVSQPQSQTVAVGTNVTFSVGVTGQQPLSYQWFFNLTNKLDGATNSVLTLSNALVSSSGQYDAVITNSFGSVTSVVAMLNVLFPPTLLSQPQNQDVVVGANVAFSVSATGSDVLNFQWRFNGINIVDATNSTLLVTNVQLSNAGSYDVVVGNVVATAASTAALLRVEPLPAILSQPKEQSAIAGNSVSFTVGQGGAFPSVSSGKLRLWLEADAGVVTNSSGFVSSWKDQSGNTNDATQNNVNQQPLLVDSGVSFGRAAIRFNGIQNNISGDYLHGTGDVGILSDYTSFLVYSKSNSAGLQSEAVVVGVPGDYDAVRGKYFYDNIMAFTGWANDYATMFRPAANTYRIWTDRMSANNTYLEMFDCTATSANSFQANCSGLTGPKAGYYVGGLASETRNFAGDIAALIYYQGALTETDRNAVESYLKAKYFFGDSGTETTTYQWQFNGTDIPGATNVTLTLTNVQPGDAGVYTVVLSNEAGSVTSSNAVLTVNLAPSITIQPQGQTVLAGNGMTLKVEASGTGPLNYQWLFEGTRIVGASNSFFTLADVEPVNAGNYLVVVSSLYGSIASSNALVGVSAASLQVPNLNAMGGDSITVPVNLIALGAESGASFSLSFDPNVLSFVDINPGLGLGSAVVNYNLANTANGQIGVILAMQPGATFAAGTQELVEVTFAVAPLTNTGVTPINFQGVPLPIKLTGANAQRLAMTISNGSVAVAQVEYEADVNQDRLVDLTDWIQVGRYVAGLDPIPSPDVFQRADCAPRATRGDGQLTVTDWVQAGRYAANLDLLTSLGGATGVVTPAFHIKSALISGTTTTVSLNPVAGVTNSFDVQIAAQGGESALAFSLNFDPTVLRFAKATSSVRGAVLLMNTNLSGKVGIAFSLPTGTSLKAGLQSLVRIDFAPVLFVAKNSTIAFSSAPVTVQLSDVSANALPVTCSDATVTVAAQTPPALTITTATNAVIVSWPVNASGFILESSGSFGTGWSPVSVAPTTNGTVISAQLPPTTEPQFYRLKLP